jgi:hypothetical protein
MDPMKLIAYVAATFITVLLVIGGLAFYIGYSAGRKDISAVRAYIAAARLNLPVGVAGKDGAPAATISLEPGALDPVVGEIKTLKEALAELQQRVNSSSGGLEGGEPRKDGSKEEPGLKREIARLRAKIAEMAKEDGRLKEDLAIARRRAAEAVKEAVRDASKGDGKLLEELNAARAEVNQSNHQAKGCRIQLTALENKLKEAEGRLSGASRSRPGGAGRPGSGPADSGALLLYDSVTLKRGQSKIYSDVDMSLSLESVAARATRVVINKQGFSINFGERKVVQHNDATCEVVLMESDLQAGRARFNIACKR